MFSFNVSDIIATSTSKERDAHTIVIKVKNLNSVNVDEAYDLVLGLNFKSKSVLDSFCEACAAMVPENESAKQDIQDILDEAVNTLIDVRDGGESTSHGVTVVDERRFNEIDNVISNLESIT